MDDFLPDLSLRHSSAVALIPLSLTYYALGVLAILPNTFLFRLLLQPVFLWQAWSRTLELLIHGAVAVYQRVLAVDGNVLHGIEVVRMDIHHQGANKEVRAYNGSRVTMFDASRYLIQLACPAVSSSPNGGSIFDPDLRLLPRIASAAFASICGGVWTYLLLDTMYHMAALIGRIVCRQPASHWPPISHHPWLSTSLHEFWSYRWHQLSRHIFVTFGARPGGALLGQPGALIGAFAVSAVLHHFAMWGIGYGSEFSTVGGFFLLMGVGVVIEVAFKNVTGLRIGGLLGWLWTMLWVPVWGIFLIDVWARHGMLASENFPTGLRPGKPLVDTVIGLSNVMGNR
ncbi:hypothetical protein EDB89DRAFT_2245211 [Lactarius sanguifluus]|nr:hypothetical protein EDB89DRAFT_2245211 [Lactarius sanguifluus]